MNLANYHTYDGLGLAKLIKDRQVSPNELIEDAFEQLKKVNPIINAVIRTRKEQALKELKQVNLKSPFAGVPIVLKDLSQSIQGERVTGGSRILADHMARGDSNFVAKIREAGFTIIGQTNTPEFGLKNITEPLLYGATRNPWNSAYSPGGSSGGAASSVSSGIVPVAGASDGGGSIRIPASFTSLVGLKPTRGRTPVGPGIGRQWHGAAVDFAVTKTVRDSAALLDVLQVIQDEAAFQIPLYRDSYLRQAENPGKRKFRIAYSTKSPVGTPVSADAVHAVIDLVKWLENEGFIVEEKDNGVDGIRLMENYYIMNCGEMASEITAIEEMMGRSLTLNDIEIVSWVLQKAGHHISAIQFTRSIAEWDVAAMQMSEFHKQYDLYITPATAFPAPKVGELSQTKSETEFLLKRMNEASPSEQLRVVYEMFEPSLTFTPFTQLANLTGQPAISLPIYKTADGLPLGVQIMAPKGKEHWLIHIGAFIEQSNLWVGMQGNPHF